MIFLLSAADTGKNTGHRQRSIAWACSSVGNSSKVGSPIHTKDPTFGRSWVTTPTAHPASVTRQNARPTRGRFGTCPCCPVAVNYATDRNALVKIYGGRRVVNGVDINVKAGEVVGLLGPNGAGKTTTFYMTVGLTPPDSCQ